jgi:ligand-binding SRPBCC domain-containing protein
MLQFQKTSLIAAPPEALWEFHRQAQRQQLLLPPWQPVQMISQPSDLVVGAITEYRLWLGLLTVRWENRVTEVIPDQSYTEQATTGLVKFWQHCHRFDTCDDGTQLTDTIQYALPGEMLVEPWLEEWVNKRLSDMFEYRHRIIQECCRNTSINT